jgi:ABC-type sulfate transport system substrate-binding protein
MLALILNEYATDRGQTANLESVAKSEAFGQYLAQVEGGLKRTSASKSGTYELTRSYVDDQTTADFIVTTESAALGAAVTNPNLAVIYPDPTAVTEESVCIVDGPWMTPEREQGATEFMQYISQSDATKSGIKLYLRPAGNIDDTDYSPKLVEHSAQGFSPTYASIELPPYPILNAALFEWAKDVGSSDQAAKS